MTQPLNPAPGRLVLFQIADQRFGLRIDNLLEIGTVGAVRQAADLPDHIVGVTTSRGREIPVLDLFSILGLAARRLSPAAPLIVMRIGTQSIGLPADTVLNILTPSGSWHALPPGAVPDEQNLYVGVIRTDGGLLLVLDEQKLLPVARAAKEAA